MKMPRDPVAIAIAQAKTPEELKFVLEEAESQLRQTMEIATNGKIEQWKKMALQRFKTMKQQPLIILPHSPGVSLSPGRDDR